MMNPKQVDFIIPHGPSCNDGYGAAYSAWKFLAKLYPNKTIEMYDRRTTNIYDKNNIIFCPMNYGANQIPNVKGRNVLICDFSFEENVLRGMINEAENLLVIDHHESAERQLKDIDDKYKIFDMGHSGAWLTWKYFFPGERVPLLIEYIQDRDIWTKKLENCDACHYFLSLVPKDFLEYDKLTDDKLLLKMIKTKGLRYKEVYDSIIENALSFASIKFVQIGKKYYLVAFINFTLGAVVSDVCNRLVKKYPLISFSGGFTVSNNSTSFSLRSDDKNVSVTEIGRGHRNAAGYKSDCITNIIGAPIYDFNNDMYQAIQNIYIYEWTIESDSGKKYNVVYLNSLICKKELSKYLLQNRYIDNNKNNISEALAILRHIDGDENKSIKIDVAAIWNFTDDATNYHLEFSNECMKDEYMLKKFGSGCENGLDIKINGAARYLPYFDKLEII